MHEELFDKYLTRSLTAEEAGRLARLIEGDPRVRDAMVAYVRETGLIIQVAHHLEMTGEASRKSTRSIPVVAGLRTIPEPASSRSTFKVASIAAGVLAGFAALLLLLLKENRTATSPERSARGTAAASEKEAAARSPVQAVRPESEKQSGPEPAAENGPSNNFVTPEKAVTTTPPSTADSSGSKKPDPAPAAAPRGPTSPVPPIVTPKPSGETASIIAYVESTEGVAVTTGPGGAAAKHGQSILAGQGVETRGPKSRAVLKYLDGSRLQLDGETLLSEVTANGRMVSLTRGGLTAEIAKQPAGQVVVIRTPQGRLDILGTRFTVLAAALETRLYVDEGRVRLTREADRASVEVKAGFFAVAAPGILLQAKPQDKSVDQAKIDAAIRKGIDYLKKATSPVAWEAMGNSDELILWTFVHAGVPESDPVFQKMFRAMIEGKLERTYKVAIQAMILEEIDRVKYQPRIFQCAQFLVDNQCRNGQWSYGEPSAFANDPPPPPKDVATPDRPTVREFVEPSTERRVKPKVVRKLALKKMREGPAGGDNSNSQYAALGLRACHDAGIVLPKESILLAKKWWLDSQHTVNEKDARSGVATGGVSGPARGWCYHEKDLHRASGSMTAGAVGGLAIYDYILDVDWKRSAAVQGGVGWLANHFSVTLNPGYGPPCREPGCDEKGFYYYFMYGLERAGMLYGSEKIGPYAWYPEGARVLVERQGASGAWEDAYAWNKSEWNTCFAILFLRRATRPLEVASEDRAHKK
jgi:hypothetical protein